MPGWVDKPLFPSMALFGAYLGIDDFSIWLRSVSLNLNREMDERNRLVAPTPKNQITLVFNSTDNPNLLDWMDTPGRRRSGTITYVDAGGNLQRITHFTNAFCLAYEEEFDSQPDATPFITTLTISAETLSFDDIAQFNHWPPLTLN